MAVYPRQTGFSNLMEKRTSQHLVLLNPADTKLRTIDGEKTLKLRAFDGERTLRMPKVTFTAEQTEAILSLARRIEESVQSVLPAPRESRILLTAKLPAPVKQVDIPDSVHVTRAQPIKHLPVPKQWQPQRPFMADVRPKKPPRQSTLNMVAKHCRTFRLSLDRTSTLKACKTALSTFGFDFMQLGDRRVICLKPSNSAKICLEIIITAESPALTEVCLLDYSRGASLNAEAVLTMLSNMQQVIEQQAA